MVELIICPECGSGNIKLNGYIHNVKQNYRCKICGREFVLDPEKKVVSEETISLIKKLLLERIALRGICRVTSVSLPWLLGFIAEEYKQVPEDLGIKIESNGKDHFTSFKARLRDGVVINTLETEADEMWSFVKTKENKQEISFHSLRSFKAFYCRYTP